MTPDNQAPALRYCEFKLKAAAELYADGKIARSELFRNEVDASLGESTGPIRICEPGCTKHDHGEPQ